jgi:hypothetical protein
LALATKTPTLFGKELDGAPSLQEREVVEVGLGAGTVGLLLCAVEHEVQVIHVVTHVVVSRHVHGASGVITMGKMSEMLLLDLLGVLSAHAGKHLLQTPGQAIGPGVLPDFKLDCDRSGVSNLAVANCLDKPPKFLFRVIRKQGSCEFRKRTAKVQNQGSEVVLKDKAPTMT